jgi:hypothetical protein
MALGKDDLLLLSRLRAEGWNPDELSVIEIGAQQLSDDFLESRAELQRIGELFGAELPCPLPPALTSSDGNRSGPRLLDAAAPSARGFWTWLGFRYAAVDIDGSPEALPIDLNYDVVPDEHRGRYRLVTNFGTTEHVANQLNAFKVIHDLTAVGGLMMHGVPAQGMFNHGLFNYNPKFFWMLARSNGYRWLDMNFFASTYRQKLTKDVVDLIATYRPGFPSRIDNYSAENCHVMAVLQKAFDIDYVAPLDVATGTQTDNKLLAERYWTVFTPDAFDRPLPPNKQQAPTAEKDARDAAPGSAKAEDGPRPRA